MKIEVAKKYGTENVAISNCGKPHRKFEKIEKDKQKRKKVK